MWPATQELHEHLSLSDDQTKSVDRTLESIREHLRNFWQDLRPSETALFEWEAFQKQLRKENTAKIRDLLNEEQKTTFDRVITVFNAQPSSERTTCGKADPPTKGWTASWNSSASRTPTKPRPSGRSSSPSSKRAGSRRRFIERPRQRTETPWKTKTYSPKNWERRSKRCRQACGSPRKELASLRQALAEVLTNRQGLELLRRGVFR